MQYRFVFKCHANTLYIHKMDGFIAVIIWNHGFGCSQGQTFHEVTINTIASWIALEWMPFIKWKLDENANSKLNRMIEPHSFKSLKFIGIIIWQAWTNFLFLLLGLHFPVVWLHAVIIILNGNQKRCCEYPNDKSLIHYWILIEYYFKKSTFFDKFKHVIFDIVHGH